MRFIHYYLHTSLCDISCFCDAQSCNHCFTIHSISNNQQKTANSQLPMYKSSLSPWGFLLNTRSHTLCCRLWQVLLTLHIKLWNLPETIHLGGGQSTNYFIVPLKLHRPWSFCIIVLSCVRSWKNVSVLTSMEQPSSEPLSTALLMMLYRSEGAFPSSYISVTPPVKSSKPSDVLPPDRAS